MLLFFCHASPSAPERAKDIPLSCFFFLRKSQRMTLAHKWNATRLPALCEVVAAHRNGASRQAQTGSMNVIHLKFPQGNSYYMCFDYGGL